MVGDKRLIIYSYLHCMFIYKSELSDISVNIKLPVPWSVWWRKLFLLCVHIYRVELTRCLHLLSWLLRLQFCKYRKMKNIWKCLLKQNKRKDWFPKQVIILYHVKMVITGWPIFPCCISLLVNMKYPRTILSTTNRVCHFTIWSTTLNVPMGCFEKCLCHKSPEYHIVMGW